MVVQKLKNILLWGIHIFLGISASVMPYAFLYMWFLYKWWDTDFFGGIILFIIEIFLLTLLLLLIDILIVRFLLKINFKNITLFKIGCCVWLILILIMFLMKDL